MHTCDDSSSAGFEIAFERRANILYALVTGTNSPETVAAYLDRIVTVGPMAAFAETVAVNRGMPVKVFDSVAEAEAWLRRQVEGPDEQHIFTGGGRDP